MTTAWRRPTPTGYWLGWVSMFLYGVFYRLFPTAPRTLAAWHGSIANSGLIVVVAGIVIIDSGAPERGEPFASIGALINIAGLALFAFNLFRGVRAGEFRRTATGVENAT